MRCCRSKCISREQQQKAVLDMNRDDENGCENLSLKETNWSHTMQSSFLDQRISCLIVQNLCLLWKDSGLSVKEYNDLATFALLSCEEISENVLLNISFDDTFLPDACGFCWEMVPGQHYCIKEGFSFKEYNFPTTEMFTRKQFSCAQQCFRYKGKPCTVLCCTWIFWGFCKYYLPSVFQTWTKIWNHMTKWIKFQIWCPHNNTYVVCTLSKWISAWQFSPPQQWLNIHCMWLTIWIHPCFEEFSGWV